MATHIESQTQHGVLRRSSFRKRSLLTFNFRSTVDLFPVNKITIPTPWPIPPPLVENGHAYRIPNATWCSAPLIVPQEGSTKFRSTVDLRPFNIPTPWPIPYLDSEFRRVAGLSIFASFDFSHGYWQLDLKEDSRDCQSSITPDGVYTPTRVFHVTKNGVAHIQSSVQEILGKLANWVIIWLDDLLMFSKSEAQLLESLELFFTTCRVYNLKFQP